MVLPVFGTILYLCFGNKRTAKPLKRKLENGQALLPAAEGTVPDPAQELGRLNPRPAQTFRYVEKKTGFHTHPCREVSYYPLGEKLFAQMLIDLETAERFIFAEYFIIENGVMWDSMVEIMARKAAQGVDVRVMYDDMGSISTYSAENLKHLRDKSIQCVRFNPMIFIKGTLNYRDHRKMLIIDGKVAFSGGVNLADEYINAAEKFGHWKDIGFRITGEPVQNYTRMFSEFWNAFSKDPVPAAELTPPNASNMPLPSNGYVLSYYDSPLQPDAVSNNLYVELLIGILLFVDPPGFTSGILIAVGAVFLICGVVCLIRYFNTDPIQAALEQNFSKGLVMILLGGFLALRTQQAIALFPLLTHLYGVAILIIGIVKLQQGVDLLRLKARYWFLTGINAVLAILFAAIILSNPFASTIVLWRVAAISLIVEAVLDVVVLIMTGKEGIIEYK